MQAVVVAVIAVVVGLGVGWITWGRPSQDLAGELATVRKTLDEARQAATREGALATKVQQMEAQIKQASESLKSEQELRQKLEKLAATKKK
jgi:uncharacterized protein HemX